MVGHENSFVVEGFVGLLSLHLPQHLLGIQVLEVE